MSAIELVHVLAALGMKVPLNAASFEWPFDVQEARPLLEWLCSSLRPSNVVSDEEKAKSTPPPLRFTSSPQVRQACGSETRP